MGPARVRWRRRLIAVLAAVVLALLAQPAWAATFTVNSELDGVDADLTDGACVSNVVAGGACTLRAAIQQANATAAPDFVVLPPGVYTLTIDNPQDIQEDAAATGDLDILTNLVISGTHAATTVIQGKSGWEDRIFHLIDESAVVRISRATIRNGASDEDGGGILSNGGSLELREVMLRDNQAQTFGGGVALYGDGPLTILQSTVYSNTAGGSNGQGGGVYIGQNADATLRNSTISGNRATSRGGGIVVANNSDTIVLNNVTITANRVDDPEDGGGLYIGNSNETSLSNSILADNFADAANSPVLNDCRGQFANLTYSLIQAQPANCVVSTAGENVGNIIGEDAQLEPLADNGGQTLTHALGDDSPARDAANPGVSAPPPVCEAIDQRGEPRPDGPGCDMGAYEQAYTIYLPLILKS
jgi:CSLREA domain-containing protein